MAKKRANGEGNIRKRSDGRWEGRHTAGYHPDTGKRIIKNVLGRTQAEVRAKLKKAIEEADSLDVAKAGKYMVAEWLRLWFEVYAKPNLRFSTAEYYRRGIELHTIPYIGEVKLNQLTTWQIQNLYRELQQNGRRRSGQREKRPGLSSSTIRGVHTMLHSALDRAVKERLLIRNPADGCVVPKAQHQEIQSGYDPVRYHRQDMRGRYLCRFWKRQSVTDNHRRDRQSSARQALCHERQNHGCGFRSFLRCTRSTGRTGRQELPYVYLRRQPRYRQPHAGSPQRRHRQLLDPQS